MEYNSTKNWLHTIRESFIVFVLLGLPTLGMAQNDVTLNLKNADISTLISTATRCIAWRSGSDEEMREGAKG